ncbi:MAG: S8 family serine peptidase [Bacteroidota bacterium]
MPLRVGIVDSGIDIKNPDLMRFVQKGISVATGNTGPDEFNDNLGHGTACAELILRGFSPKDIYLFVYKAFDQRDDIDVEIFRKALIYAVSDKVDILNCSVGSIDPDVEYLMREEVSNAVSEGLIIISAWNDEGYTTWPANFDNVISVKAGGQKSQRKWGWERNKKDHFIFRGTRQRIKWRDGSEVFIGGSSFATALCTRTVARFMLSNRLSKNVKAVRSFLKDRAQFRYQVDLDPSCLIPWNTFQKSMKKVGIYPFHKEMHGFVRFRRNLPYHIVWIADLSLSRNGGKFTNELLKNCDESIFVHSELPFDPGGIDTLILGYLDKASEARNKDLLGEALEYALQNRISVFSFLAPSNEGEWRSRFESVGLRLEVPQITYQCALRVIQNVPEKKAFDTPILGIFGTGSRQGKFTLQLGLRYELQRRGFKVGQIGTEHQSGCFGMDFTFPSGYGAQQSLRVPLDLHIPLLRRVLSEMDKGIYDVVIVGGQSGLMSPNPYYYGCIFSEMLFTAALPDRTILVTNRADPHNFVERVKSYIFAKTGQEVFQILSFETLIEDGIDKTVSRISNLLDKR